MRLKSHYWIELVVVIGLLVLLLWIFVPLFLRIQKGEIEKQTFIELSVLLTALQQYSLDYPVIANPTGLRDHIALPFEKAGNIGEIYKGGSYGGNEVECLANVFALARYLDDREYLEDSETLQYFSPQNPDAFIHYISQKGMIDGTSIHYIGLAFLWPYADPKTLRLELANAHRHFDRAKFIEPYVPDQSYTTLLKQDYYFSLTNGVTSFGYVYCDTLGNRSYIPK